MGEGGDMISRVEYKIADHLFADGLRLYDDVLTEGMEYTIKNLTGRHRTLRGGDIRATESWGIRGRLPTHTHDFIWRCCELGPDYWIEVSKLYDMWKIFRWSYSGTMSSQRFGTFLLDSFPSIKRTRKRINRRQASIYTGITLLKGLPSSGPVLNPERHLDV